MNAIKWLISGFIGGLVGAVAWALIYHFANFELGIIAWGVGALAGVGVRATAGDSEGFAPGAIAVIAALLALGVGKVGGIYLDLSGDPGPEYRAQEREYLTSIVASEVVVEYHSDGKRVDWPSGVTHETADSESDFPRDLWTEAEQRYSRINESDLERYRKDPSQLISQEYVITYVADAVVNEWEEDGRTIKWPDGVEPYTGQWSGDYPTDAWDEALNRWDAMSTSERLDYRHAILPLIPDSNLLLAVELVQYTFTFWDLLWFGLALASAYKLGSNEHDD